LIPQASP